MECPSDQAEADGEERVEEREREEEFEEHARHAKHRGHQWLCDGDPLKKRYESVAGTGPHGREDVSLHGRRCAPAQRRRTRRREGGEGAKEGLVRKKVVMVM